MAWLLVASLCAVAPVRAAPPADHTVPRLEASTLPSVHSGTGPLVIDVRITDDSAVFEPTLFVRASGTVPFARVPLLHSDPRAPLFRAQVPDALLSGDIELFLEVFDAVGNGPARLGSPEQPLRIVRRVPPATPTPTPTPSTATPPTTTPATPQTDAPPEDNTVLWIAVGVGAAVAVLAIAGGVALALYAFREPAPDSVSLSVSGPVPTEAP